MTLRSTLLLGMGNSFPSDDGVGLLVAERQRDVQPPGHVKVRLREVAGLRLLELVRRFTCVIIIDALNSPAEAGREPGEIMRYESRDFKGGQRWGSAHSIGIDTAPELGRKLGCEMPGDVTVFAIEAADVETFGAELSLPAAAAERVIGMVREELGAA